MKYSRVEAIAPATSANLGAGFDIFSVAIEGLSDTISVEINEKTGVKIHITGIGSNTLPVEPTKNTAGVVAGLLLERSKRDHGLNLIIEKGIKPGSGLGSSAASAAAAAIAVNAILELDLTSRELIEIAAQGEIASAGAPHADNVSAAILGHFTIIRSYDPLDVIRVPSFDQVGFVLVIPEIEFSTSKARSVLPSQVTLSNHVSNLGNAASFVAGLVLNDINLMGKCLTDSIIEPARESLIAGLKDVKQSALNAGALGVTISGAGPSLLALVNTGYGKADDVARAMKEAFLHHGVQSQTLITKPSEGAKMVGRKLL